MQIHFRTIDSARKGFTVIEVIIVIAMMGILVLIAAPFLSNSLTRSDFEIASSEAVDALREARSSAMNGKGGGRFGVHFETSQFVFFTGATYSAVDLENVVHTYGSDVTMSNITITGGGSDVHFATHKGEPTENGAIEFTIPGGETKTVTVNAVGLVDVQ